MAYRIIYEAGTAVWIPEKLRWGRILFMSGVLFAGFCFVTLEFWIEGGEILQTMLYPGDAADIKTALQHMAFSLKTGEPLSEAVYVFCREILAGANYSG